MQNVSPYLVLKGSPSGSAAAASSEPDRRLWSSCVYRGKSTRGEPSNLPPPRPARRFFCGSHSAQYRACHPSRKGKKKNGSPDVFRGGAPAPGRSGRRKAKMIICMTPRALPFQFHKSSTKEKSAAGRKKKGRADIVPRRIDMRPRRRVSKYNDDDEEEEAWLGVSAVLFHYESAVLIKSLSLMCSSSSSGEVLSGQVAVALSHLSRSLWRAN